MSCFSDEVMDAKFDLARGVLKVKDDQEQENDHTNITGLGSAINSTI